MLGKKVPNIFSQMVVGKMVIYHHRIHTKNPLTHNKRLYRSIPSKFFSPWPYMRLLFKRLSFQINMIGFFVSYSPMSSTMSPTWVFHPPKNGIFVTKNHPPPPLTNRWTVTVVGPTGFRRISAPPSAPHVLARRCPPPGALRGKNCRVDSSLGWLFLGNTQISPGVK